jgi:hypothetical protein
VIQLVKVIAHGILSIPALEALVPGSQFYDELNGAPFTPVGQYCFVRANFDQARSPLLFGWDLGVDLLFGHKPNDLVVPFAGASEFDKDVLEKIQVLEAVVFGSDVEGQGKVYHTNYFEQPEVWSLLRTQLIDDALAVP